MRTHHLFVTIIVLVLLISPCIAKSHLLMKVSYSEYLSDESHMSPTDGGFSLRFMGNGANDIDRIKIRLDAPEKPIDVVNDFTIEFWVKAYPGENSGLVYHQGNGDGWITGNVIIDRDIYGQGDYGDYGIALGSSPDLSEDTRVLAFGIDRGGTGITIRGHFNVADSIWHHVAATRNGTTGEIQLFVDGVLDTSGIGPTGNISYRNWRSSSWSNSDPFLVFGAEKHDAGSSYPSLHGWLDEVRISNVIRYTSSFTKPLEEFSPDTYTVGLYHFNEGEGNTINDAATVTGSPSTGTRKYGGTPAGPEWSLDIPFGVVYPALATLVYPDPGFKNASFHQLQLRWNSALNGSSYRVQLSLDSSFSVLVMDTSLVDTNLLCTGLLPYTTYYWRVNAHNVFGSSGFTLLRSFTTQLDVPILLSVSGNSLTPVMTWSTVDGATSYHIQISIDTTYNVLVYEDSIITDTIANAGSLQSFTYYYWRVKAVTGDLESEWSASWGFYAEENIEIVTYPVTEGWNLFSLPLTVTSLLKTDILPTASSNTYRFANGSGYIPDDTLDYGSGYWVKYHSFQGITITGSIRSLDTIEVVAGWNLIGSISTELPVSLIGQVPANIIESSIFGYTRGYLGVDALLPGKGYWVKIKQNGVLILSGE